MRNAATEAELRVVKSQLAQKETVVDRYFTDYEDGKILLETRIAKISDDLAKLRLRRDQQKFASTTCPNRSQQTN